MYTSQGRVCYQQCELDSKSTFTTPRVQKSRASRPYRSVGETDSKHSESVSIFLHIFVNEYLIEHKLIDKYSLISLLLSDGKALKYKQ